MANKTSVLGMSNVRQALQDTPKEMRALLREAVGTSSRIMAVRLQGAAPVRTGQLRSSIVADPPKGRSLNAIVRIKSLTSISLGKRDQQPANYVMAVEYGKYGRPFIRPTAESEFQAFVRRMQDTGPALERVMKQKNGGQSTIGSRNL